MRKRSPPTPAETDRNYEDDNYLYTVAAFQAREKTSRRFLDQFLLSIIDAYPPPAGQTVSASAAIASRRTREKRLRAAKKALFSVHDIEASMTDEDLLFLMATIRRQKIEGNQNGRSVDTKVASTSELPGISDRQLARDVAKLALGTPYAEKPKAGFPEDKHVERLRKKFAADRDYYIRAEKDADFVAECLERNSLEQLKKILTGCGINMKVPLFTDETPREK